jgi:predicted RNA binding protein YcfA (HicA-like mRNA interferase family)
MKLPRDMSGDEFVKVLEKLGYEVTRQTGSHIRLTTNEKGEHHVTIPRGKSLRVGTLATIITSVAEHFGIPRDELVGLLFKK